MNKNTKILLVKLSLLFALTWGTIEFLYDFNFYQKHDLETAYTATIIDKYSRLQNLKSPKIVLIAGSNFAYGINSEMMESAFKLPVVNMAMHYDYGTDFMLKQITPELHNGDTVIMGFEYIIESEGDLNEKILLTRLFPKAKEWFSYKDCLEFIGANAQLRVSNFRLTLQRLSHKSIEAKITDTTSIFFRNAINKYGDLISHFNNPSLKTIPLAVIDDKMSFEKPIIDMNLFDKKMQEIGVKVFYVYPSYAESSYKKDLKTIGKIEMEMNRNAKFQILGKPTDFVYNDTLFHDMVYHLNVKGRDIRTQKLINLLKNNLK